MEEMRKSKRSELHVKVEMKLIKEGVEQTIEAEITNVSKGGIGFKTREMLMLGECYQTTITLWTKEKMDSVVRIIRAEVRDDGSFVYGATFVGMQNPDILRILIYQMLNEDEK